MAKKVTITTSENEHPLQNLSDPWGGMGPATVNGIVVPADTEWGMNRGEVEYFIKSMFAQQGQQISDVTLGKIGYIARVSGDNEDDPYRLVAFATEADYNAWVVNHDDPLHQPIIDFELPSGGGGAESGRVMTIEGTAPDAVQADNDFNVNVTVNYQYFRGGVSQDLDEQVTLTIQTSVSGEVGTWVTRGTRVIETNTPTAVSMKDLLPSGEMYVRINAADEYTSVVSPFRFQVNVVNLTLTAVTSWNVPIASNAEFMALLYKMTGSVSKLLSLSFGTADGTPIDQAIIDKSGITGNYVNEAYMAMIQRSDFASSEAADAVFSPGVHTVTAVLMYNYGTGVIETSPITNQYMVTGGSDVLFVANNIPSRLSNWSTNHFFDWAIYNPAGTAVNVRFTLMNRTQTQEFAHWDFSASNNEEKQFITQLALENLSGANVSAVMVITAEIGGQTVQLHEPISYTISNNATYAPSEGADFILNPADRSNSETNRATVTNAAQNGAVVANSNDFVNFDFSSDGWVGTTYNGETVRVLRVPAGRQLTIHYNPFQDFTSGNANSQVQSMVLEMDFLVDNIVDDNEPILVIGSTTKGFTMYPSMAVMRTAKLNVDESQDVAWAEGVRQHLAVAASFGSAGDPHYMRIYLNGVMEREFAYDSDDTFTAALATITIGNTSSDIDIFGIRSYRKALQSTDIMQDYVASMTSLTDKVRFAEANNILDNEGNLDWAKCIAAGYNVIGHTGHLLRYEENGVKTENTTQEGDNAITLEIRIAGDDEHSRIIRGLENKGQGTTAMGYYWWNQQYKVASNTTYQDINGNDLPSQTGKGYSIAAGEPAAKKMVGKVNFASSMQSHKLGLTWAYTDIFKRMISNGDLRSTPGQFTAHSNARIAVFEKPFLFFQRDTENDEYVFRNLMTFGPGKGDKPAFGFSSDTSNMMMVEGADNDVALALFNMPWDDINIAYNAEKEAWCYPGTTVKNINFGFGETEEVNGEERPVDGAALASIKAFFNFVYQHNPNIVYADGRPSTWGTSGFGVTTPLRWTTYDNKLYRFNQHTNSWVGAGIGNADVFIATDYYNMTGNSLDLENMSPEDITEALITARVAHFKAHAAEYFHIDDALYHYCFIKFFAGTDNRAKNTYYYTDPVTLKIRWMQDDLDTVLKTDNVGHNRKPYYVEEHTKKDGSNYWSAESSVFNTLLEMSWDSDVKPVGETYNLQETMRNIMKAMSQLGGGSIMGFMEKYLLAVQRTAFPAAAYNAAAKQVYEFAYIRMLAEAYSNGTNPLSQSCGSQLWSEYQWLVDRIMFISSWCQYGEFVSATDAGGITWRSGSGTRNYTVTPAKQLYPRFRVGSSNYGGTALTPPGSNKTWVNISFEDNTQAGISGNNYLWYLGDMDVWHSGESLDEFIFTGRRLRAIDINPGDNPRAEARWGAKKITLSARNIERFVCRNATALISSIDFSRCVRLQTIDLRGCSNLPSVTLPATGILTSAKLPAGLTSLIIEDCPNLATVELEGYASLTEIVVRRAPNVPSLTVVTQAINNNAQLNRVILEGVNWQNVAPSALVKLAEVHATLTGTVSLSGAPTLAQKLALVAEYGNVDNPNNPLYITGYTPVEIASISISGEKRTPTNGDYQYTLNTNPTNGNNVTGIHWSISENSFATIDPDTGLLHVTGNPVYNGNDYAIITCEITVGTGTAPEPATFQVGFFERKAQVGDLVYHDGTFGPKSERDANKTVVGVCFYSNDIEDGEGNIIFHDRRMISMNQIGPSGSYVWGPYNNASNGIAGFSNIQGVGSVYNVGNIPDIKNSNNWTVNRANYWQGEWPEGQFKYGDSDDYAQGNIGARETGPSGLLDAPANSYIPVGRKYTLEMIALRNKILNSNIWSTIDSVEGYAGQATTAFGDVFTDDPDGTEGLVADTTGRKIPRDVGNRKEFAVVGSLFSKLNTLKDSSGTAQRYGHLLFQAASMCYAYEPSAVGLVNKFKAHNWYLPSAGEMCRIYWHMKSACDGNAPFSGIADCAALHSDYMWTSGEYDNSYAWYFNGSSGVLSYISYTGYSKYYPRQCRAACAF